jgi:hypothetical protein
MTSSGWTGGPGLSTFYFAAASLGAEGQPEATEAAARVQAYITSVRTVVAAGVLMNVQQQVDQIDPATGNLVGGFTTPLGSGQTGSGSASFAPTGSAVLGQLLTAVVIDGRRVRGRTFMPPTGASQLLGTGDPSNGTRSTLTTALGLLGTTIVTPLTNVVWHRPRGGSGGSQVAVNGYAAWSKMAVLRSRRD